MMTMMVMELLFLFKFIIIIIIIVIVVVLFFLLFCLAKLKVLVIINERKKIVHVYISSVGLVVFPSSLLTLPCKKLIKNCKRPLRIYI